MSEAMGGKVGGKVGGKIGGRWSAAAGRQLWVGGFSPDMSPVPK
jgi:hypothetical protein